MKPLYLIAKLVKNISYDEKYDYIGIDAGALYCMKNKIPMLCAVGDFDSIGEDEKEQLRKITQLIELPSMKNETDTETALLQAKKLGYHDITLLGGLGGRKDHELANIKLLQRANPPFKMMDENNILEIVKVGEYRIEKIKKYISLIVLEDSELSIQGVKYELIHRKLSKEDIYTISNEIVGKEAQLNIYEGSVLLIQSDDV